jgi:hypothetical protein
MIAVTSPGFLLPVWLDVLLLILGVGVVIYRLRARLTWPSMVVVSGVAGCLLGMILRPVMGGTWFFLIFGNLVLFAVIGYFVLLRLRPQNESEL